MGDEHHIPPPGKSAPLVPDGLAQPPLDAISNHGVSHFPAHSEPKAALLALPRQKYDEQMRLPHPATLLLDAPVVGRLAQSNVAGKAENGRPQ